MKLGINMKVKIKGDKMNQPFRRADESEVLDNLIKESQKTEEKPIEKESSTSETNTEEEKK